MEALDEATDAALSFARRISGDDFRAVHVPASGTDPGIRPRWYRHTGGEPPLEVLHDHGGLGETILEQVWRLPRSESDFVTVVVPEQFRDASFSSQVRRPRELALKFRLLAEPGVVVADVPAIPGRLRCEAKRLVVRVLVSHVNATSMRAVNYAQTLGIEDTRAVHLAFSSNDANEIRRDWAEHEPGIPLEIDEAPYRDIGGPLRRYLRTLTEEEGTTVLVLMPELVTRGWRRILHNQNALYVKRLLLFEPGVILASVPYQILR